VKRLSVYKYLEKGKTVTGPTPFAPPKELTEKKQEHSLFGSKHVAPPPQNAEATQQLANASRRLLILEERYNTLRKKLQLSDQSLLKVQKEMHREVKSFDQELIDQKRDFMDLHDKVRLIIKEIKGSARTEEVKILERYLSMWDPLQFMTKDEVRGIVEQVVDERLQRKR
jgi:hypothetical protein